MRYFVGMYEKGILILSPKQAPLPCKNQFQIVVLSGTTFPLQGLCSFVIFLRPRYLLIRKNHAKHTRFQAFVHAIWYPTGRPSASTMEHKCGCQMMWKCLRSTGKGNTDNISQSPMQVEVDDNRDNDDGEASQKSDEINVIQSESFSNSVNGEQSMVDVSSTR
jgi:hypothetical protein